MGLWGGYKLVDFNDTNLVTGGSAVTIPKIYSRATALFCKRFVACNLSINGSALSESDMMTYKDPSTNNLICKVGDYIITITPQNAVTATQSSGLSQEDRARLDTITLSTGKVTYDGSIEITDGQVEMTKDTYVNGELSVDTILVNSLSDIQTGSTTVGDELDKKVERIPTEQGESPTANTVYIYGEDASGNPKLYVASANGSTDSIALRKSTGAIEVLGIITDYDATNKQYVDHAVSAKQDILTAGSGIDITNNVISATGSGSLTAGKGIDITSGVVSIAEGFRPTYYAEVSSTSTVNLAPAGMSMNYVVTTDFRASNGEANDVHVSTINLTLPDSVDAQEGFRFDIMLKGYQTTVQVNATCEAGETIHIITRHIGTTSASGALTLTDFSDNVFPVVLQFTLFDIKTISGVVHQYYICNY